MEFHRKSKDAGGPEGPCTVWEPKQILFIITRHWAMLSTHCYHSLTLNLMYLIWGGCMRTLTSHWSNVVVVLLWIRMYVMVQIKECVASSISRWHGCKAEYYLLSCSTHSELRLQGVGKLEGTRRSFLMQSIRTGNNASAKTKKRRQVHLLSAHTTVHYRAN